MSERSRNCPSAGRQTIADAEPRTWTAALDSLKNWAARGATHPGALQWRTVREFSPRAKCSVKSTNLVSVPSERA